MKQVNGWNVYDKDGKFLCSYGIGWSLVDIFASTPKNYLVILTIDGKDRCDHYRDSMRRAVAN